MKMSATAAENNVRGLFVSPDDAPGDADRRLADFLALEDDADRVAFVYALPMVQRSMKLAAGDASEAGGKSLHETK